MMTPGGPCVWVLLTGKDGGTYDCLMSVLESLGSFQPDTIMVDFEAALRKSLASTFPDATVDGGNFHFCQALYRNVGLHGLKIDYDRVIIENGTRMMLGNSWTPSCSN